MSFFFVSYLILINLYLIMSKNKEKINKLSYMQYMQSGLIKIREKLALVIRYVLRNMSSIISIKNEIKQKINSLNKQIDSKLLLYCVTGGVIIFKYGFLDSSCFS